MPRQKTYFKYNIPSSVVCVVTAIISDYDRREREIKRDATGSVLARYVELNSAVDRALSEIEAGIRADIMQDITEGKGYERSRAQFLVSKNAYYRRRRKLIHDIAVDLCLLE